MRLRVLVCMRVDGYKHACVNVGVRVCVCLSVASACLRIAVHSVTSTPYSLCVCPVKEAAQNPLWRECPSSRPPGGGPGAVNEEARRKGQAHSERGLDTSGGESCFTVKGHGILYTSGDCL